jgi:hypothetical protein
VLGGQGRVKEATTSTTIEESVGVDAFIIKHKGHRYKDCGFEGYRKTRQGNTRARKRRKLYLPRITVSQRWSRGV